MEIAKCSGPCWPCPHVIAVGYYYIESPPSQPTRQNIYPPQEYKTCIPTKVTINAKNVLNKKNIPHTKKSLPIKRKDPQKRIITFWRESPPIIIIIMFLALLLSVLLRWARRGTSMQITSVSTFLIWGRRRKQGTNVLISQQTQDHKLGCNESNLWQTLQKLFIISKLIKQSF